MEKLRPEEREQEYMDFLRMNQSPQAELLQVTDDFALKLEKDGMFDAYDNASPEMPDNEFYMKGYNSVKQSF